MPLTWGSPTPKEILAVPEVAWAASKRRWHRKVNALVQSVLAFPAWLWALVLWLLSLMSAKAQSRHTTYEIQLEPYNTRNHLCQAAVQRAAPINRQQ